MGSDPVGQDPGVLAYGQYAHWLFVAAESGMVSVLDLRDRSLVVVGSGHLAGGAHVVAVDLGTRHSLYLVSVGVNGRSALLECEPIM